MSSSKREIARRYPIGAELRADDVADFRVWAPKAKRVEVAIARCARTEETHALQAESDGYFRGAAAGFDGMRYGFRIDGREKVFPDPASRYQPDGPHGRSSIVDPAAFKWSDEKWPGVKMPGQVLYEMHIGTFTPEGSWQAAMRQLPELARIGITVIEMMPIADFCGEFGWGYDGVDLFAPTRLYGTPDDLRAFINEAHSLGLGVILDVVYNHLGPEGNYLREFSDDYFTDKYENEWGDPLNFDGPESGPVREFFITNGRYWIEEFHFDGFRFDATQSIFDDSDDYIVGVIGDAARKAAGKRSIILVAENEPQQTKLLAKRSEGGDELDALWNDDWHHSSIVALNGRNEAYYTDYRGAPQEFISAAKRGYLFQGQRYEWQDKPRGTPGIDLPPEAFITFIENHDQVSNCAFGQRVRLQSSAGRYRAMTALLLLAPSTPLLFQGQEFGASTPFVYFNDASGELRAAIQKGRFEFLMQFPSMAGAESQSLLAVPGERTTFERCKLDFAERDKFRHIYDLHCDLLKLRRVDACFAAQKRGGIDGAVLTATSFVLRFFGEGGDDRLLLVNLGNRTALTPAPEPLLAPPAKAEWQVLWTSESPRYGGPGAAEVATAKGWVMPAESALVLKANVITSAR